MPNATADIYTIDRFFSQYALKVPSYQREFSWEEGEIRVLFRDLFEAFEGVDTMGELKAPEYFLGAIVTQEDQSQVDYLVDGQQRITCLFLLMCALTLLCSEEIKARLLLLLRRDDQSSFVLQVPGYDKLFREFLAGLVPQARGRRRTKTAEPLALVRLRAAFGFLCEETAEMFSADAQQADAFASWMLQNVFFARIQDTDPEDAERLFDRINTRGRPLSVADIFRGKVLSALPGGILGRYTRSRLTRDWNEMRQSGLVAMNRGPAVQILTDALDAERRLLTAWLIGRYAGLLGDRGLMADVKAIRRDPYAWADECLPLSRDGRAHEPALVAKRLREEFFRFVEFAGEAVEAEHRFVPELAGFRTAKILSLELGLAMTAAIPAKQRPAWLKTLPIIARFLDVVAARRGWMRGWRSVAGFEKLLLEAIHEIRTKTGRDLALALQGLIADAPSFTPDLAPGLTAATKTWIRYMLLRFDWHLGEALRLRQDPKVVFEAKGALAPEIEHLMGDDFQAYRDMFGGDKEAFDMARNRLGALALLPKKINAGLQTKPYGSKLSVYLDQRPLIQSLCVAPYDKQNRFNGLARSEALGLAPVPEMGTAAIAAREKVYARLANEIWNAQRIGSPINN